MAPPHYRAGGITEALRFGYLTGFERFRNARLAGETPDLQWVIDDRSDFYLRIVVRELVRLGSAEQAADLYRKLTTQSRTPRQLAAVGATEPVLATLAALSGSEYSMAHHLARAAAEVDKGSSDDEVNAHFAQRLAESPLPGAQPGNLRN